MSEAKETIVELSIINRGGVIVGVSKGSKMLMLVPEYVDVADRLPYKGQECIRVRDLL